LNEIVSEYCLFIVLDIESTYVTCLQFLLNALLICYLLFVIVVKLAV